MPVHMAPHKVPVSQDQAGLECKHHGGASGVEGAGAGREQLGKQHWPESERWRAGHPTALGEQGGHAEIASDTASDDLDGKWT